jgi:hypothetical protein
MFFVIFSCLYDPIEGIEKSVFQILTKNIHDIVDISDRNEISISSNEDGDPVCSWRAYDW